MKKRIESRSDVQKDIEEHMLERIQVKLGRIILKGNKRRYLDAENKVYIYPDFFSEREKVIGEIHAHIGRLKPAQQHKIAADALKMILHDKACGDEYHKYIAVCDISEYECLTGESYLAKALREFEIDVLMVEIPENMRRRLRDAMKRQDLTK